MSAWGDVNVTDWTKHVKPNSNNSVNSSQLCSLVPEESYQALSSFYFIKIRGGDLAKAGLGQVQEKRTRASSLVLMSLQNLGFDFYFESGGCDEATFPLWQVSWCEAGFRFIRRRVFSSRRLARESRAALAAAAAAASAALSPKQP